MCVQERERREKNGRSEGRKRERERDEIFKVAQIFPTLGLR
jgi:hypothetical protein